VSAEPLPHAIRQLAAGHSLTQEETAQALGAVMAGDGSPAQVAALLVGLRVKGETSEEVAGGAEALRRTMLRLDAPDPDTLVDTCGTGGGAITTFNISTAAALLAAGAGARIAKHGNRSFATRSGSADVLEALGVKIELSVAAMRTVLDRAGIVFMFAPLMHPAMRHVGAVRRDIAIPTMMNLLGPLANPAGAGRQVIGVADPARVSLVAGALIALGTKHSLVVHGEPGLDEISPLGCTHVVEIRGRETREWTIDPARVGHATDRADDLVGGSAAENALLLREVLGGQRRDGARAAVLLNAAAAIYVAGLDPTFESALVRAAEALAAGRGTAALERLRHESDRAAAARD